MNSYKVTFINNSKPVKRIDIEGANRDEAFLNAEAVYAGMGWEFAYNDLIIDEV